MQAGGVYVPLGSSQPAKRLAVILEDLRPAVVVTERRLVSLLDGQHIPVVTVDAVDGRPVGDPADLPAGDPGRLAYMIYTSGSTGRPKAVMVPHAAYTHHCRTIAGVNRLTAQDRSVLLSALTFDLAMEQLGAILLIGGAVVISDVRFWTPEELPDRIHAEGVTHVLLTPAYYREFMAGVRHRDPRLAHLRVIHVGGEVVTYDDARRWFDAGLSGRFLCAYGPTETTIVALTHELSAAEAASVSPQATLPIGRPVPGTRAYVLDETLRPVPVGVVGELCIGGARVSLGYLHRPRLTADRFVPDPFGGLAGERLYRTGDFVRFRRDGIIEFVGRIDNQVKLRGFRIELAEIEAALASHPGVRAAVVEVRELTPGDRRLVGYVVPRPGSAVAPPELRHHLESRVPEYMVPGVWSVLDELPLTPNKKVDRRALPTPDIGADVAHEGRAPGTEVEEAIAEAWADVLRVPAVAVDRDFFELGGHSLLVTRLLVRLENLFALRIPLRVLFEATTVTAQAAALEQLAEQYAAADRRGGQPIGEK
jgi:amino acid adenylation domain-containing protein